MGDVEGGVDGPVCGEPTDHQDPSVRSQSSDQSTGNIGSADSQAGNNGNTRQSDTQHGDTQHGDTQHGDTQHGDTQHGDTHTHTNEKCDDVKHGSDANNDVKEEQNICETSVVYSCETGGVDPQGSKKGDHMIQIDNLLRGKDGGGVAPDRLNKQRKKANEAPGSACCEACRRRCSRVVVLSVLGVMAVVYVVALGLGLGLGLDKESHGSPNYHQEGVAGVAADHTACSVVGRNLLAQGGSAVDAAIGALLCNGVRQPHSMGIGGGVFLVVYDRETRSVDTYDGRERAPLAATYDLYRNKSFLFGNLSIGVPGEIQAYWAAHQKYGRLAWKALFQPAIRMAAEGHYLSNSTARALRILQSYFNITLTDYPELCKLFCREDGSAKTQGDTIVMAALARTLEGLADLGPDYLYSRHSPAATALIQDVQDMGGLMVLKDLEDYKVVRAPPINVSLGNLTLHTLTAPSGGPVLALVTQIIHGLNLTSDCLSNATSEAAMWHKVVEAFKFAYADRLKLGDPAYVDIAELLDKMAAPEYAAKLRDAIDPDRTYNASHYTDTASAPWREEGTTHISVIDVDGNAVSATSTINYYFGSLLVSPSTGIILNNEMADFSTPDGPILDKLKPSSPNFVEPGKRPLSSMAPVIITDRDGNPRMVLGSSGGSRITNVNAQVMLRVLWLGQSLEEAINAKRLHHQLFPNVLKLEPGFPEDVKEKLRGYGHVIEMRRSYMAVVQAMARDPETGAITAFSDPRKNAKAKLIYKSDV